MQEESQARDEFTFVSGLTLEELVFVTYAIKPSKAYTLEGLIIFGGEGGIRTHGSFNRTLDFESSTIGHSDTSPYQHRSFHNLERARRSRKNSFINAVHSSALTPAVTAKR